MEAVPTARVEVVSVAVLLRPLPGVRVAVPIVVVPLRKVTVPVGAALVLETVAVKVTVWPKVEGLREEVTAAVDPTALTT
jgi:hypothetical protein